MDSQQTNSSNGKQLSDKQTDKLFDLAEQSSKQQPAPSDDQPVPSQPIPPKRRPLFARILARFIIILLVACVIYFMTSNPWLGLGGGGIGAAIIGALGLISNSSWWLDLIEWLEKRIQEIVIAILPGIRKRVKGYQRIVRVILLVIGFITVLMMTFAVLLLAGWVQTNFPWQRSAQSHKNAPTATSSPAPTHMPSLTSTPTAISVTTRGDSLVGLSDGRYVFDAGLADNVVKQQAARAITSQRYADAQSILEEALNLNPTDAEARIYEEDARIRASGSPYFTFIVVTTFTTTDSKDRHNTGESRDILQGACMAQITYNNANPSKQVLLLIANAPDPRNNASTVATQIIQDAEQDPTIVGVIGWPSGSNGAIEALGKAHIPIVSPTSLNSSSGAGGYYFSVAPSIDDQTKAAVLYAQSRWKVSQAAVFYDPGDQHSKDLAASFTTNFQKAGGTIVNLNQETYSTDSPSELVNFASSLITAYPNLKFFYFAGYPADASQLLQNIHDIHVIAGDSLDQMVHCPVSVCPIGSLSGLYFTAAGFQDEAKLLKPAQRQTWLQLNSADFFTAYQQQFNTGNAGNPYNNGGRISSDVMLAYDATSALLYASQHVNGNISAQTIRQGLQSIHNVYGVSGHISFDSNGNPQQKAVLILWPSANGIKLQSVPPPLGYY